MADGGGYKFYHYDPNQGAAILFIIIFLVTTLLHTYQMVRTKTWFFIPFVIGGHFEWIGYIGRAISHTETPNWTLGPYILQNLFLLLAPALFAASIYMELGRIIALTEGEHLALIRRRWLTKIFVTGDVLSFCIQGGGGGIMATGNGSNSKLGTNIIVAGLIVQLVFFGFFVVVAAAYERNLSRKPTDHVLATNSPWKKHLRMLYVMSALILVRCIFRAIEFIQGNDGYLLRYEVFLYVFDTVLMWAVMVVSAWVHPSEINAWLKGGKYVTKLVKLQTLIPKRPDLENLTSGEHGERAARGGSRGNYQQTQGYDMGGGR